MWMRLLKRIVIAGALLLIALLATGFWAHRQTQKVPEFYERAISVTPRTDIAVSSRKLDENVEQLQSQATQAGSWEATFEADQINAWMIDQLPSRFPKLVAKGIKDPLVVIEDDELLAAVRLQNARIDAVVSCELKVQLTDQPNRLAITVDAIRIGALPIPISQVKDRISKFASGIGVNLEWEYDDDRAVVLVDVPDRYESAGEDPVMIESITLLENQINISGRTGRDDSIAFEPSGPIYYIASLEDDETDESGLEIQSVIASGDGFDLSE